MHELTEKIWDLAKMYNKEKIDNVINIYLTERAEWLKNYMGIDSHCSFSKDQIIDQAFCLLEMA